MTSWAFQLLLVRLHPVKHLSSLLLNVGIGAFVCLSRAGLLMSLCHRKAGIRAASELWLVASQEGGVPKVWLPCAADIMLLGGLTVLMLARGSSGDLRVDGNHAVVQTMVHAMQCLCTRCLQDTCSNTAN